MDVHAVLPIFFALVVISATYIALWRLYRHPLVQFPGPKLAALTGWYTTYYDLLKGGSMVEQLEVLHRRYGEKDNFSISLL